jgi:hypothetical protein
MKLPLASIGDDIGVPATDTVMAALAGLTLAAPMPPSTVPLIVAPFTMAPDEGGKPVTEFVDEGDAGDLDSPPQATAITAVTSTPTNTECFRIISFSAPV